MGARSGKDFLNRLDNTPREIWLDNEKISKAISQNPYFQATAQSIAQIYDMQHDPILKNEMTYASPTSGELVGTSFLQPRTIEDLIKRRKTMRHFANYSGGMLRITPDFLNSQLMAMASAADFFGEKEPQYEANLINYYEYIRENDLLLSFAMGHVMANKSLGWNMQTNPFLTARLLDKNEKGITIRGARSVLTNPLADEILVFPTSYLKLTQEDLPYTFAFAIPLSTRGLKLICSKSSIKTSHFDFPLSSRFEEHDVLVVFDDVLVPWERVFILGDLKVANTFYKSTGSLNHMLYQTINRDIIKTEFLLGLASSIVITLGSDIFIDVQKKIVKIIAYLEMLKAFLTASEANATLNKWNIMTPDFQPLSIARHLYPDIYLEIRSIISELSENNLITIPSEKNIKSEIRKDIDLYYEAKNTSAEDRIKLFHLAWDIAASSFGFRQALHDKIFLGDLVEVTNNLYHEYDRKKLEQKIWDFLRS